MDYAVRLEIMPDIMSGFVSNKILVARTAPSSVRVCVLLPDYISLSKWMI